MAKKTVKAGPSGSQLIRDQIAKGVTKPSEIIAAVQAEHGIGVSNALVNSVKTTAKKKAGKIDKAPKPAKKAAAKKPAVEVLGVTKIGNGKVSELELAKLALRMGGVQNAIDALTKLLD